MKKKVIHQWLIRTGIFGLFFQFALNLLADYPPQVVIDGSVYQGNICVNGTGLSRTWGFQYTTSSGVLLLQGNTGGVATWGSSVSNAFTSPTVTGTWDGSSVITLTGHACAVAQVLVYYPSAVASVPLVGYDGVEHQPIGSGTATWWPKNGEFVMAYGGLSDGYIFNFGNTSSTYRYQAGPQAPVSLDTTNGWPPRNLYAFPSQITDQDGHTLSATSYTEGFNGVGYWSSVTYEDQASGDTGLLNIIIDAHDSGGELSGDINGDPVDINWNASINAFPANLVTGVTFKPRRGPLALEWNGSFLPFKWTDVLGSDVYGDSSGKVAMIDANGNGNVTDSYTTFTFYWDGAGLFTGGADLATVSSDGMNFVGFAPGLIIYTKNSPSGSIYSCHTDGNGNQTPIQPFTLRRPDGTIVNLYDSASLGLSNWVFSFSQADTTSYWWAGIGTPVYYATDSYPATFFLCNGSRTIDATNVFPSPDITFPISSFNGFLAAVNQSFPEDAFSLQGYLAMWSDGSFGGIYEGLDSAQNEVIINAAIGSGTFGSASISMNNGGFAFSNLQTLIDSGTVHSDDGFVVLSLNSIPQSVPNPTEIGWNGKLFWFSYYETNGAETYYDSSSDKITITTSNNVTVTPAGAASITGTYNPLFYSFNFGTNTQMWNIVVLDGSGNPLGGLPTDPQGLIIYNNSADASFGQSLQLADGSVVNASPTNSCVFWSTTYSCYAIKYIGITDGAFFSAQGQQDYSQAYRCTYPSGGGDFEIWFYGDYSEGGWWSDTNIYPNSLYINGQYAAIDSSTLYQGGSGPTSYGGVAYHVVATGETFSIDWSWGSGFYATVNGSYGAFPSFSGSWDGGNVFGSLPDGLHISPLPPSQNPSHGPPSITWNGVQLTFNSTASAAAGADVYTDNVGLGFSATINAGSSGSPDTVALSGASGTQFTGTYDPTTYQFSFAGQSSGSVLATNGEGQVLVPTVPVAGSGGGGAGTNTGTLGNFDIQGNVLSLGSWTLSSGGTMNGLSLVYTDASGGQPSLLSFMAARQSVGWIWSHADTNGGSSQVTMMQLDPTSRLMLSGTANPSTPTIILDPNGKSHIEPQGDMGMGPFTAHP